GSSSLTKKTSPRTSLHWRSWLSRWSSSQCGSRSSAQVWCLRQEMFIVAIERLIAFRLGIPPYADGQNVGLGCVLHWRGIHCNTPYGVLFVLDAPGGHR